MAMERVLSGLALVETARDGVKDEVDGANAFAVAAMAAKTAAIFMIELVRSKRDE